MSWATKRRLIILCIVGASFGALFALLSFATLYKAPSCVDGLQNQDETGIDCGGGCAYLCSAAMQPPTVLFTKILDNGTGRTDVLASIENKNQNSATREIPYRVTLFDANQVLIQEVRGVLELPPGTTIPLFIPGIAVGKQTVTKAFLTLDDSQVKWYTLSSSDRVLPVVVDTKDVGTETQPRIEATLQNTSVTPLRDVSTLILVHDVRGQVIAVSETLIPLIPAQGEAKATFTWNGSFTGVPAVFEVIPRVPLP